MAAQDTAKGASSSPQPAAPVQVVSPAPAPTPEPIKGTRDAVQAGPQPRGPHGRFAPKATQAPEPIPGTTLTGLPVSADEQAARDKMYEEWPEMATSTWGPRAEKPASAESDGKQEQPKVPDAPKAEAASETPVSDKDTQALKLAGFTDAVIAKLAPEDIASIAEAQRQRNAGVEAKLREAAEAKKQQTVEPVAKESAKPRPLPDSLVEKTKKLAEQLGSEEAGELFAEMVAEVRNEFLEQQEAAQTAALVAEINKARGELGERLPELRDEAKFRAILDEVDDMSQTKRWGNKPLAERIVAAHKSLFPGPTPAQLQSDRLQQQGLASPPPAVAPSKASQRAHQKFRDPFDTAAHAAFNALGEQASVKEAAEEARLALHGE